MIERNLGNAERLTRLVIAIVFGGWAVSQPAMNGVEWFVVAVSIMLILNGIFSRCYFWYLLDINTKGKRCETAPTTFC